MKKQKFNVALIIIVSLLVAYFILKDDFSSIVTTIARVNVWWLVFSVLIVGVSWFFSTLALAEMSVTTTEKLSFKTLFKTTVIGNFFSAITPSATGGQPFQVYYLKKRGVGLGTATNIIVEQSTLYQIALVVFGLVAILLNTVFDFFPSDILLKKLVIIGFAVNILVIGILCFITFGKKSSKFLLLKFVKFLHKIKLVRDEQKMITKVESTVDNFYTSAKTLNSNKEALIKGIIYNFISLAFLYVVPLTLAYSLGIYDKLNVLTTLVSSAYVMLIGAFVPIPGGSGGIEYAFAAFFGFYITGPTLMALLIIWRFVTYYLTILLGGLQVIFDRHGGA